MILTRNMPDLDKAINEESWEWLMDHRPDYAKALLAEVRRGATPDEIRHHFMKETQRPALAMRLRQATAHLIDQEQE